MKKILLLFLILSFQVNAQRDIKLMADMSRTFSIRSQLLGGTSLTLGSQFSKKKLEVDIYGGYQLSREIFGSAMDKTLLIHLLGGGVTYYIGNKDKRVQFLTGISAYTEIGSNYKDGYLDDDGEFSASETPLHIPSYGAGGSYFSNFYQSTPLISNLLVGVSFRIKQNFKLYIAAGFGIRLLQYKTAGWSLSKDYPDNLEDRQVETVRFRKWDVKIGLNYTFSLQKKKELNE